MPVIKRTEYRNNGLPDNPRTGDTGHGESMVDVENYLLPAEGLRTAALHGWGVAGGLTVSAGSGTSVVTVLPGIAVDVAGRAIMLVPDGAAVVEQPPPPPNDVPTVAVTASGVGLDTTGLSGDLLVTVTWLEAGVYSQPTAPQLVHAPWLQLLPAAGFADTGEQVVLAAVTLDQAGQVTALTAGPRRTVDLPVAGIRLRRPASAGVPAPAGGGQPGTAVTDPTVAALTTCPDGGVQLTVGLPAASAPVLTVAGSGAVSLPGATSVSGTLSVSGATSVGGVLSALDDVTVARDLDVQGGVSVAGMLSVADGASVTAGLQVTGVATLTGAVSVAGDLTVTGPLSVSATTDLTGNLVAHGGVEVSGRLSSTGAPDGGALDVRHRMRVRQGNDSSAGIWLQQNTVNADRAFVGMMDDDHVGLYGVGCGWGLTMHVDSGRLSVAEQVAAGQGVLAGGVTIGTTDAATTYPYMYETVGVSQPQYNLRLQSPNSVIVHTQGAERMVLNSGALTLHTGLAVASDAVVGAGGDGAVRVRHVRGKNWTDDADDDLYLNWNTGRAVHVGGNQPAALDVSGTALLRGGARISGDAVVGAGANGVLTVRHVNGKNWTNDADDDLYLNWSTGRNVHVGGGKGSNLVVAGGGNSVPDMPFPAWSGGGIGTWDVFARGAMYVGGNPDQPRIAMYSDGTIKAGTIQAGVKLFVINHPLDPEHRSLQHVSLEGAEAGVYYRGQARLTDGRARIVLPEYFEALTRPERRTVLLTPVVEDGVPRGVLGASRVADGCFVVVGGAGCPADQAFCWQVTAVRADVDELQVEVARSAAGTTAPNGDV